PLQAKPWSRFLNQNHPVRVICLFILKKTELTQCSGWIIRCRLIFGSTNQEKQKVKTMDSNNLLPIREKEAKQERLKIESEELLPACESVLWTMPFSQNRTRGMHAVTKAVTLLALSLLPLLLTACDNTPKKRTVCVTGLNEFERPMYRF